MGRSIAIVEDEPLIRANYVEALNRFGYDARDTARGGKPPTRSRCGCRNW
jgi:FOG: CheY-like receiver